MVPVALLTQGDLSSTESIVTRATQIMDDIDDMDDCKKVLRRLCRSLRVMRKRIRTMNEDGREDDAE